MITKNEAHRWTVDKEDKYWLLASIRKTIYSSIFNGRFECEWCTPYMYEVSEDEATFINSYVSNLKDMGYDVSGGAEGSAVKLHISWN